MKRLLSFLMGFVVLLLSSTEGWSLPPCPGSPTASGSTIASWTDCLGTLTYKGSKYVGEWKDGIWHGQGTATLASGSKYVGDWKDGKTHGQGTYTFANGDKYVGEWKDDKRHGQGTYTWADGSKYVGGWKDGKFHGPGIKTHADGRVEEGIWENSEFKYKKEISPTN